MLRIRSRDKRIVFWLCGVVCLLIFTFRLQSTWWKSSYMYRRTAPEIEDMRPTAMASDDHQTRSGYNAEERRNKTQTNHPQMSSWKRLKLEAIYSQLNNTAADWRFPANEIGTYVLSNPSMCSDARSVDVIMMVHTAPKHFARRNKIRTSFAKQSLFLPFQVRVVFLLGSPREESLKSDIYKEHRIYKDTVVAEFIDDYHNLTLKGVMGLRWIVQHCPNSKYILKIDDDVIIDTFKLLLNYIPDMKGKEMSLFCNVWRKNMRIERTGRWAIPRHMFSRLTTFPYYYCSGFTVIMTSDLAAHMYSAAQITPFFWVDDVYVYGILPKVVGGVTYHDYRLNQNITLNEKDFQNCLSTKGKQCPYFATLVSDTSFWEVWRMIETSHLGSSWEAVTYKD